MRGSYDIVAGVSTGGGCHSCRKAERVALRIEHLDVLVWDIDLESVGSHDGVRSQENLVCEVDDLNEWFVRSFQAWVLIPMPNVSGFSYAATSDSFVLEIFQIRTKTPLRPDGGLNLSIFSKYHLDMLVHAGQPFFPIVSFSVKLYQNTVLHPNWLCAITYLSQDDSASPSSSLQITSCST